MSSEHQIEQTGREAFLLKRAPLPTLAGGAFRSFFGGLPLMPPDAKWPYKTVGSRMRPLTFVAQIQLEDLPCLAKSPLPRTGTLCFFLNLTREWLEADDATVLYFNQPAESFIEHRSPMQLMSDTMAPWFWLDPAEVTAYPLYKYSIEFSQFRSYASYAKAVRVPGDAATCEALQRASLLSLLEADTSPEAEWMFDARTDNWPFAWSFVEHATRALLTKIERAVEDSPEGLADELQAVVLEIETWLERSRQQDIMEVPDPDARSEFRTSWSEWQARLNVQNCYSFDLPTYLAEAVRVTSSLCKARGANDVVPAHFQTAIHNEWRSQFRKFVTQEPVAPAGLTQMLGYGEPVQSTSVDRIDDVLLLQIKSEVYGPWWPDSDDFGVIQFWISPEDLIARRFERVTVNFDCT